jgi:hypothetical protein
MYIVHSASISLYDSNLSTFLLISQELGIYRNSFICKTVLTLYCTHKCDTYSNSHSLLYRSGRFRRKKNKQGTDLDLRWSLARYSPASTSYSTLHRKSDLCIPRNGTVRSHSQFQHSFICERLIYSQDRSAFIWLQQNRQTDLGSSSQIHESGNWETNFVLEIARPCSFISGNT